jgi:hypothetical protein
MDVLRLQGFELYYLRNDNRAVRLTGNTTMRETMTAASIGIALLLSGAAHATEAERHFDGIWDTVLSCVNSNGALGYSFQFPSTVKEGVLHGEKGSKGQAGWLQLDGKILKDGSANLYAAGLVGAAPFAVGQRPAGTEYGYHIDAKFTDASGKGARVEGRPCTVTFTKT